MELIDVAVSAIGGLLLVIGYFLKMVHSDVRINTNENGSNRGRIDQLQIKLDNEKEARAIEMKHQADVTQTALLNLTESIAELSNDVRELIRDHKNNSNN